MTSPQHASQRFQLLKVAQTTFTALTLTASLIALSGTKAQAVDIIWDNGGADDKFSTAANWDTNAVPSGTDTAVMNIGGTVTYDDGQTNSMYNAKIEGGTVFNMSGGTFNATQAGNTLRFTVGNTGTGTVNQSGGTMGIGHLLVIGWGTTGDYNLSGGLLNVSRTGNALQGSSAKPSISLGPSSGDATLNISGGSLTTRAGIELGSNAEFKVTGSRPIEIGIGSHDSGDGYWNQLSGATLSVEIDFGGLTKIFVDDVEGTSGNFATFAAGTLLDVDYFAGFDGGGTWTVLELENADITDGGLAFAPGVDTNVWSFAIDNTGTNGLLTVTSSNPPSTEVNAYWDGSENSVWEEALNWTNNYGAFDASYVHIDFGTVDYTASSDAGINLRGFRMEAGTLNISGGTLRANAQSSAYSQMDGTVNHADGLFDVNALDLGRGVGSNAHYILSGGELKIGRASGGHSLYIGANSTNSGSGTLTISGGKFTTRTGVKLGDNVGTGTGRFVVLGAHASEIGIAGANDDSDGFWKQYSGSTLEVGVDFAGVTPIFITDSDTNTNGTYATFESGALLDVDYYNITEGGGTWVVMEVENGDIIDNGLSFAPGVNTSIWSFAIDNSGSNGRLTVTAVGTPIGYDITIGNTPQQKMRYGMDYERLWSWSGNLNSSERDDIARWSAVDTDIDYIRVAMNSGYELTEGVYNLSAYTNKIIPLMQEMQQANPNLKFFASPRPLNEAESGADWQPFPRWVTGQASNGQSFAFDEQKCAEYMVRYINLMDSYGFKISFMDMTNEWNFVQPLDAVHIKQYMEANLLAEDVPLVIAPSAWSYSQGTGWLNSIGSTSRQYIDIAGGHNTNRSGSAQAFAVEAAQELPGKEIWNTEQHGWKSTSNENETTSFFYYLESIRAGFSGINGWLAIGQANQGHAYILNPSGTPTRNVKYHIFQKLSSTSNYGHALDIINEPASSLLADLTNEYDSERNVAAFIKGNLMTVWVINENASPQPLVITPTGYTIATSTVRQTRWTDPSDVEGFESHIPVTSNTQFATTIPGESVACYEIVLNTETFANQTYDAKEFSHSWGIYIENNANENVAGIKNGYWTRYGSVALDEDSYMSFGVARPAGRPDGFIRIREGSADGPILGEVDIPETGNWQNYQTVQTALDVEAGIYNLYLEFVEDAVSPTNNAMFNLDWFEVQADSAPITEAPTNITANPVTETTITLNWDAVTDAIGYTVKRSGTQGGPYTDMIDDTVVGTTFTDSGLTPDTTYNYVVVTRYDGYESDESSELEVQTDAIVTQAPTNVTETPVSATSITLNWDAVPDAIGYTVKRSETEGGPYPFVDDTVTGTTYTDTGVTAGTQYYYVIVTRYGDSIVSEDSDEIESVPSNAVVPQNITFGQMSVTPLGRGNTFNFSVMNSELGHTYQAQKREDLATGIWIDTEDPQFGTGGILDFVIPIPRTETEHYFRVDIIQQ